MRTLIAVAFTLATSVAEAHPLQHPRRDTLTLRPDSVGVLVRQILDEEEAMAVTDRFDLDSDGRLDEMEGEQMLGHLAARVRRDVRLSMGGVPVGLVVTSASLESDAPEVGSPEAHASVAVLLEAPLPQGDALAVSFADVAPAGRRLPLVVELVGWRVDSASSGRVVARERTLEVIDVSVEATPWTAMLRR